MSFPYWRTSYRKKHGVSCITCMAGKPSPDRLAAPGTDAWDMQSFLSLLAPDTMRLASACSQTLKANHLAANRLAPFVKHQSQHLCKFKALIVSQTRWRRMSTTSMAM